MSFITWIKSILFHSVGYLSKFRFPAFSHHFRAAIQKDFASCYLLIVQIWKLPACRSISWCREVDKEAARTGERESIFLLLSLSLPAPRALILVSRPWIMQRPLLAWFSAWALFIYERARSHPHLQSADDFVWIIECPCPAQTAFSCSAAQRKAESATQSL
jgi:hypothetical protein